MRVMTQPEEDSPKLSFTSNFHQVVVQEGSDIRRRHEFALIIFRVANPKWFIKKSVFLKTMKMNGIAFVLMIDNIQLFLKEGLWLIKIKSE
jgi:hypothetical protein